MSSTIGRRQRRPLRKQGKSVLPLAETDESPEALNTVGNALAGQGQFAAAANRYEQALALRPDFVEARNNLGNALYLQGQPEAAVRHYEQALALRPNFPEALDNLGTALMDLGRLEEAVSCYERALTFRPDFVEVRNNLGVVFSNMGRLVAAEAEFRRLLAVRPHLAEAHYNLARILRLLGRHTDALAEYEHVLKLSPDHVEAHLARAELKRFRKGDPDLAALETVTAGIDTWPTERAIPAHFVLGQALEEAGEHDRAFGHFQLGNRLKRSRVHYHEAATLGLIRRVAAAFTPERFAQVPESGSSMATIFILGMPRTGSTLVEQILASHPQVQAAGERSDLAQVAAGADGVTAYPECLPILDRGRLDALAEAYRVRLPALEAGKVWVTDKTPSNFLYLGLIWRMLPKARIVHTVRDPRDTCVSCFCRLFEQGGPDFSYDLGELGRYYQGYAALMAHWRTLLPPDAILEVRYEDMVEDLEGQSRRLLAHCGLPWDDRCLRFHETERAIQTSSAIQVRRPLYRSALGRWRGYEQHLGPLFDELGLGLDRRSAPTMAGKG